MLTLLSVRLVNWRMIKDATFSPLAEGITGIAGRNGSGKSTFLDATLWALYGVRPVGVPMSGLRRDQAGASDECSATVEFKLNGHVIKVVREIRGRNNINVLNTWLDGKETTKTTVTPGEKWIKDHLKIDAEGFMTAFVVRQKELDALVSSGAAERRTIIERLSGIERMSQALRIARDDSLIAKKVADAQPGSEDETLLTEQIVAEHEAMLITAEEKADDARRAEEIALETLLTAQDVLSTVNADLDAWGRSERDLERAMAESARIEALLAETVERLSRAKINAKGGTQEEVDSAYEVISSLRSARQLLAQRTAWCDAKVNELTHSISKDNQTVNDFENRVNQINRSLVEAELIKQPTKKETTAANNAVNKAEKTLTKASDSIVENGSQISSLEESLSTLTTSVDGSCPTCKTVLKDPDLLIDSFKATLNIMREHRVILIRERDSANETFLDAKNLVSKIATRQNEFVRAQDAIVQKRAEIEEFTSLINGLLAKVEESRNEISELLTEAESRESISDTDNEIARAEQKLAQAQHALASMDEVGNAEKSLAAKESELIEANKKVDRLREGLALLHRPSSDEISRINNTIDVASRDYESTRAGYSLLSGELLIARERLSSVEKDMDRASRAYLAKQAALSDFSRKTAIVDVLDEFRKAQVARIAPELSETATSLISAMTNGKYTEVLMDENFTPSLVNANGGIRPISWLSGGEVSVVSLALRIAIADLITGGTGGMIWLDEILTAQDAERRANLIETLRSRAGSQIIMINHTPEASDIVDKTVSVVEEDDGSIIIDNV